MVGTRILPNNMRSPLPNVTRHSGLWPHTVTPSLVRTLHQFFTINDPDLITEFDFLSNCARFPWNICNGCGIPTEEAYSSGHLVMSHFGTCMCSNVETNLSWTCLVSGLLNFEHPSVLLFCFQRTCDTNKGRLLLRTPDPVPLRNCVQSYFETSLCITFYVFRLNFEHPSVLFYIGKWISTITYTIIIESI